MGQSAFADALVQTLLGWLRWLADIAWSLLQGGGGFLRWFSAHWAGLLVGMIAVCLFVDWLIWMLRWRPYWLWFHKKRPVVVDDAPAARKAVEFSQPRPQPPRFHSTALRNDEEAFYEEMEDLSESAEMFDEAGYAPGGAYAPLTRQERFAPTAGARSVAQGADGYKSGDSDAAAYGADDYESMEYDSGAEENAYGAAGEEFPEEEPYAAETPSHRRYMRPESELAGRVEEDVKPLTRRERRIFFEGEDNGEDGE